MRSCPTTHARVSVIQESEKVLLRVCTASTKLAIDGRNRLRRTIRLYVITGLQRFAV